MKLQDMPNPPARILLSGFPGSGKTGALAALANAGYKLRVLDYDGNWEILKHLVTPGADIDLVSFEDSIRMGSRTLGPEGVPTAFTDGDRLLDRWRYKQGDDWVDLGSPKEWGEDHVVCLDHLGGLGQASWYRALVLSGATPTGDLRKVYQLAADEQLAFIRKLNNLKNKYHVVVLSHLKLVSPLESGRNEDEAIKEFKRFANEAIPTRLYPTAVGRGLSQSIAGEFSTHIRAVTADIGGKVRRTIEYLPDITVDLKLPARPDATASLGRLEAADGLPKIFAALGHTPPGCVNPPQPKPVDTAPATG